MRKIFQKWLFLFTIIAFFVTFILSLYFQTKQAEQNALNLINLKMGDAEQQLQINKSNLDSIRMITDSSALAKVHAFAQIIALDNSILTDEEKLQEVLEILDVDEVHISDEKGILIQSIPANYEGYDMNSNKQSAEFMPAITSKDFQLVQEPQAKGIDGTIYQYAGVSRVDKPGIVQIGYRPERLQQAMEIADIKNLAVGFRIGNSGSIIVCKDDIIVSADNKQYIGKQLKEYGVFPNDLSNKQFYATIGNQKCIGIAKMVEDYKVIGVLPQDEMYLSRNAIALFLILCNIILFAVIFISVSLLVQKIVISGIQNVNRSLKKISEGDLDEKVNVNNNPEFKSLSTGINKMVETLKKAINDARTRIDNELKLARAIQISSLPNCFPPYPDKEEFDIYATMHTAKEVGGDFYDYFLIDNDNIAVLIADVSGKGIPASLFMMKVKTLLKSLTLTKRPLHEVFTEANKTLCENNDAGMFVTVWMGILEISTGKFTFVNAGHNTPLLKRANGNYDWLETDNNFILGGMENMTYKFNEIQLFEHDKIYMYTDGVTEALNSKQELFTEERLKNILNQMDNNISITDTLIKVKSELDNFMGHVEQADDITMLGMEYMGGNRK